MAGLVSDACMGIARKYDIRIEDMLILYDGLRTSTDEAARAGFREGFRMAQTLQNGRIWSEDEDMENDEGEPIKTFPEPVTYTEKAFMRADRGKYGKRLHFNKTAGSMFGDYKKADLFLKNGNLFIFPTNDGAYTVGRCGATGHIQICCADILDEMPEGTGNYPLVKRDNHIVARI